MYRYILILLTFFVQSTYAQRSDLEGHHLSGKIKVYKQVTHKVYSFTHGVNSATTDSVFCYYDKKGMLTKYVAYSRRCWVTGNDTSNREFSIYVSDYVNGSPKRQTDTGYTYDFLKHDTDYHFHAYNMDEERRIISEESNSWFKGGYTVHTIERNTRKDGKLDSIIVNSERTGEKPQLDMIKKFTYGTLTDTMMVYYVADVKFTKKVVVLNSPTGRKEMVTIYDLDNKYTQSTEYLLYTDDDKEPEYKVRQAQLDDHRNGDVIFTTTWHKDKYGNYLRTATHKGEEINDTYFEIEYYK